MRHVEDIFAYKREVDRDAYTWTELVARLEAIAPLETATVSEYLDHLDGAHKIFNINDTSITEAGMYQQSIDTMTFMDFTNELLTLLTSSSTQHSKKYIV